MRAPHAVGFLVAGLALLGAGLWLGRRSARPAPRAPIPATPAGSPARAALDAADPRASLVFAPFDPLTNASPGGAAAARLLLTWLDTGDDSLLREAQALYRELSEIENFGGEYPTLEWFCGYALADEDGRAALAEDDDGRRFVDFFARDGWTALRDYLRGKYGLARMPPDQLRWMDELVRFNSPSRAAWEHADELLALLDVRPGMTVADVGAGGGFFTWRLAGLVGPAGRVLAVETNERHLDYLRRVAAAEELANVEVVATEGPFPAQPPDSLDRILLVSTYQAIYLYEREDARTAWLDALKTALKPDGLVLVSENEPAVPSGVVPYRGTSVSRPLIEGQLLAHGFEIVAAEQPVPQRYLLVLREAAGAP